MAQLAVAEAGLLGAKKHGHTAGRSTANFSGRRFERIQRVLQLSIADRRRADHQAAIRASFLDGGELPGFCQNRPSAYRGNRFAKGLFERFDQAQIERPEVAHGARGCADVERIAGAHQDDGKIFKFGARGQSEIILRREKRDLPGEARSSPGSERRPASEPFPSAHRK